MVPGQAGRQGPSALTGVGRLVVLLLRVQRAALLVNVGLQAGERKASAGGRAGEGHNRGGARPHKGS